MYTIYVYILDTMADWELGHAVSELNSGRFFKRDAQHAVVRTVSASREPIYSMGGLEIVPACLVDEIVVNDTSVLILPGADTWKDPRHGAVMEKAGEFLALGAVVCAICGATAALADCRLLDKRPHTSNGPGFLEMVSSCYKGQSFYVDEPSVADDNLITAGSTGALLWAKQIIGRLGVFEENTLEAWYDYFRTGKPEYFFALMQTLSSENGN